MKTLLFGVILGFHSFGVCEFSVKCRFVTHETVYTETGEVFRKFNQPYIIGMTDPILSVEKPNLRIQDPIVSSRYFLAEICKSQPPLLGYDCFAFKNYFQGKVPAIYLSRNDREFAIIKSPVGSGLLGETELTNVDYYSCPN